MVITFYYLNHVGIGNKYWVIYFLVLKFVCYSTLWLFIICYWCELS